MFTRCLARPPTPRIRGKRNNSNNQSPQQHNAKSKINRKQTPSNRPSKFNDNVISENSELQCPHFAECSGCVLETDIASPPILHRATSFFKETLHYENFKLHAGNPQEWRHRARLAVRLTQELFNKDEKICVGLFKAGSHYPVDIPHCTVHQPALNVVADLIRSCIDLCDISPYDEATGKGQLRYIQLALIDPLESKQDEICAVQVILVWNASSLETSLGLEDFAETLWLQATAKFALAVTAAAATTTASVRNSRNPIKLETSSPPLLVALHSIHANFQPLKTNAILGPNTVLLHGIPDSWTHFTLPIKTTNLENVPSSSTGAPTDGSPSTSTPNADTGTSTKTAEDSPAIVRTTRVPISFDPNSFMQANPAAMTAALQSMQSWIPPGSNLVDLHAGVGTIGIALAATQNIASLRAVEINPSAEKSFWKSWRQLKKENTTAASNSNFSSSSSSFAKFQLPEKVEYFVAAAGSDPERWLHDADVAIVDPPRKGLEPELLKYFCGKGDGGGGGLVECLLPRRLIYLSCGFPAFERDAQRLVDSGLWKLVSAEAFLFFPGTDHIETLAVFDRI